MGLAQELVRRRRRLDQHAAAAVGWAFAVTVFLGAMPPESVRVELYAEPLAAGTPVPVALDRTAEIPSGTGHVYRGSLPASRPAQDYTPRIVPHHPGARVPMEAAHIRWPR